MLITDDLTNESFELLLKFVGNGRTVVEIIPVNTVNGANIPNPRGRGFMKDENGSTVHSALNMEIINKLDAIDDIHINPLTLDNSDMELLATSISSNLEFNEANEDIQNEWQDEGYWLIIPLAFFVLMWFRRGWVIYSLLILASFSSCSEDQSFRDLWVTKDYQAQQMAEFGDYENAAETYIDALRKGVAYYKAENYEKAIEYFQKDSTAMGVYNL